MWSRHEFRHGRFRERLFDKGDLKYVILELLQERPSHGYELIRALESRMGGFYAPSPGAVYPTLQMLEDMGYVTSAEQDGKRVYTITDAGRTFLSQRRPVVDEIFGRMREAWDPAWSREAQRVMYEMRDELRDLGRSFAHEARTRWPNPEQVRRIRDVVAKAKTEIQSILSEQQTPTQV